MSTLYDFLSVALFLVTVGLFFHFSQRAPQKLGVYLAVGGLCAVVNQIGNHVSDLAGIIGLGVTVAAIYHFIIRTGGVADEEI